MKTLRLMLVFLTVIALLTIACKAKEQTPELVEEQTLTPAEQWTADVKALVEKWEAKVAEGNLTDADLQEYVAAKKPLMEAAQGPDFEAQFSEDQKPLVMELMQRMDKLDNETIPAAMKK